MSKKPTRSRHRIPAIAYSPKDSEPIDERYQAEIDASMARLERMHRRAQKALDAAERRAERARVHAENLARNQEAARLVAEKRAAEEVRLSEYLGRIKDAARNARLAESRAEQERKQAEVLSKRNAVTALRKAEARESRERERLLTKARAESGELEKLVEERRRELREIELLMMPTGYAGRDHRAFTARHTSG